MTADLAGSIAVSLELDEPEQVLSHLKQEAMKKAEALKSSNEFLADKWSTFAEGLADTELKLQDVKRKPV